MFLKKFKNICEYKEKKQITHMPTMIRILVW